MNRRLVSYVLLNIFVSALVTGTILFFYDRAQRGGSTSPENVPTAALSAPTPALQTDIPIEIVSVTGAGTLGSEVVLIRYGGAEPVALTGWRLTDSQGNSFTFPSLTLYEGGAVQVNSTSGSDTVVNLFWGRSEPVWESGDVASLFDAQGNLRALYRIP
jgi:hypothetical protein